MMPAGGGAASVCSWGFTPTSKQRWCKIASTLSVFACSVSAPICLVATRVQPRVSACTWFGMPRRLSSWIGQQTAKDPEGTLAFPQWRSTSADQVKLREFREGTRSGENAKRFSWNSMGLGTPAYVLW